VSGGGQVPGRPVATASAVTGRPRRSRVTPVRVALAVGLSVGLVLMFYGARIAHDDTQMPILVAGMVIFGLACLALALAGATTVVRAGKDGDTRSAFFAALLGGVCALLAAGSLGGAVILAMVWRSA